MLVKIYEMKNSVSNELKFTKAALQSSRIICSIGQAAVMCKQLATNTIIYLRIKNRQAFCY